MKSGFLCVLFFMTIILGLAFAKANPSSKVLPQEIHEKILRVGVFENPPFSFRNADGDWTGIAVELFQKIAVISDLRYTFSPIPNVQYPILPGKLLDQIDFSRFDLILWSLPCIVLKDNSSFTYTLPYYMTGLVSVQKSVPSDILRVLSDTILSKEVGFMLLGMILLTFIGTFLLWLFEKEEKDSFFRREAKYGLWDAFWWCASVTSTIFACNLYPKTTRGRILSIIWMFTVVTFFWSAIGTINSSITIKHLHSSPKNLNDVSSLRVVVVKDSYTELLLRHRAIPYRTVNSIKQGFQQVEMGQEDVFLCPDVLARYFLKQWPQYSNLAVTSPPLVVDNFAFIVPTNSPLLHELNYGILLNINTRFWNDVLFKHLGSSPNIYRLSIT